MDTFQAARLINEKFSYRPGWRVTAEPSLWILGTIHLYADLVLQDSDKREAPEYNRKIRGGIGMLDMDVSKVQSETELAGKLLRYIQEHEIHEMREFFKWGADYEAPFHPHTPEGQANWEQFAKHTDPELTSYFGN